MPHDLPASDCLIIIFGASGDLTKRKLIPALYHLWDTGQAPKNIAILGIARSKFSDDEFRDAMYEFSKESYPDEGKWREFAKRVYYHPAD